MIRDQGSEMARCTWIRMLNEVQETSSDELLGDLLRQVSPSFYLSLAILPASLRRHPGPAGKGEGDARASSSR